MIHLCPSVDVYTSTWCNNTPNFDPTVTLNFDLLIQNSQSLSQKSINAKTLAKFSPVMFKISCYRGQNVHFPLCCTPKWPETLTFDPQTSSGHPRPKMHQYWKFGENKSNTLWTDAHTQLHTQTDTSKQPKYDVHNDNGYTAAFT